MVHLENFMQLWLLQLKKHIVELEKFQKRATKMIKRLKQLPHEERLQHLKLLILKRRRMRWDIIKVYKNMHSVDKMEKEKLFSPSQSTRTKRMKLNPGRIETDKMGYNYYYYFTQYVIKLWIHYCKI